MSAGASVDQGVGSVLVVVVNPLQDRLVSAPRGLSPPFGVNVTGGNLEQGQEPFPGTFVGGFEGQPSEIVKPLVPFLGIRSKHGRVTGRCRSLRTRHNTILQSYDLSAAAKSYGFKMNAV